jgi:hypothetical protein
MIAHEDASREQHAEGSTDRSFGFVFAGFFLLVACWPLFSGQGVRLWAAGIAAVMALIAALKPALLAAPNRQWTRLGILLGRIVSPIALAILFYAVFTPFGIVLRIAGMDPLRLKRDPEAKSYWLTRAPPGPPPDSMTNQF